MKLKVSNLLGNSFDTMYDVEPSMMICTPALEPNAPIEGYTDLTLNAKLNAISELNLCVHKIGEDGNLNPCYGYVEKRKYIYMEGIGYFRITDCSEENGGDDDIKKIITAESKEAELGNINVPDLGTVTNEELGLTTFTLKFYNAYVPTSLPDKVDELDDCVLRRIEDSLIGWSFDLSDLDLDKAQKQSSYTFGTSDGGQESVGENIYNFLTTTVADAFELIFLFDTLNSKIIPVYRDEYYNKTSLFFDRENIVESSRRNEKEGTFCTCLELAPTDELVPYINKVNPTGKYLYDFSYYLDNKGWMDSGLASAIRNWQFKVNLAALNNESSNPQVYRCLEAWTAMRSMNEKAKENTILYQEQYNALAAAKNTAKTEDDIKAALKNTTDLSSDVAHRAGIMRDDGTTVGISSIEQGVENISVLETLCEALGAKPGYRNYFEKQNFSFTLVQLVDSFSSDSSTYIESKYNIAGTHEEVSLAGGDELSFKFKCTALPQEEDGSYAPVFVELIFTGIDVESVGVNSVNKVSSTGRAAQDTSSITINKIDNKRVASINEPTAKNEYYEIKWNIGSIEQDGSYKTAVNILGTNDGSPRVELKFSCRGSATISPASTNFSLSDASFEANPNSWYTYTNSDFVIDSTARINSDKYGYHIWTPAFPVFNNMVDPDWTEETVEVPIHPFNKETNIIDSDYIENIQYVTHSDEADLRPCLICSFNEVNGSDTGSIPNSDIAEGKWTYAALPEDLAESNNSSTTESESANKEPDPDDTITGYQIRLHFYGYVKIGDAWVYKKLKVTSSVDGNTMPMRWSENFKCLIINPDTTEMSDKSPYTFSLILNTNLPKFGEIISGEGYTEVQYMRIELLTGNPHIFYALTIIDPILNYNAKYTDLFSFNDGSLYPEKYFDGQEGRPHYSKLFPYINTLEYTNENIVVVDTDDMAKKEELALEFITEAKKQFTQNITPIMECTIDSGAEIFSNEYSSIRDDLALGSFCQIEFDTDDYSELPLEELSINWQECNFSMTFGTFRKKGSRWADLMSQTISNQKSMDVKTTKLYSYVLDDTLGSVSKILSSNEIQASALNIVNDKSDGKRNYSITDGGITFSTEDELGNIYQVLIADGSVACSKMNKKTKIRETTTALGKYILGGQTFWGLYGGAIIANTITADKIQVGAIGGWVIDRNQMLHSTIFNSTKYIDALISASGVSSSSSSIEGYSMPSNGINNPSKTWKLLFGSLDSNNTMQYTFGVDTAGILHAKGAQIEGTITQGSSMGGWTIDTDRMHHTTTNNVIDARIIPGGHTITDSQIGGINPSDSGIEWQLLFGSTPNFGVDRQGYMYAQGGNIGGWTIDTNNIENIINEDTSNQPLTSLISDGIIPVRSSGGDRLLIGNFVCTPATEDPETGDIITPASQSSSIYLPNYERADKSYSRWQILSGTNNSMRFGLTTEGHVYMKTLSCINNMNNTTKIQRIQSILPYTRFEVGYLLPATTITTDQHFPDGSTGANTGFWGILMGESGYTSDTFTFGMKAITGDIYITDPYIHVVDNSSNPATHTTKTFSKWLANAYTLPVASDTTLGGIMVGSGLTINNSVLSLRTASSDHLGGVKINGGHLAIDSNNVLYATYSNATTDADGLMSATDKTKLNNISPAGGNSWFDLHNYHAGSSGFNEIYRSGINMVNLGGVLYAVLHISLTRNSSGIAMNTYNRFFKEIPSIWRPAQTQTFSIKSTNNASFNIRVYSRNERGSNGDYGEISIARTDGNIAANTDYPIYADIWYKLENLT